MAAERIVNRAVASTRANADDREIVGQSFAHQPVEIDRLVGAVEIANAEMDDAGREFRAVIGRAADALRQLTQVCLVQLDHGLSLTCFDWLC